MKENLKGREVIIEFVRVQNIVRVSAMDVQTLTEVIAQAPTGASEQTMKHMILQKLDYVLRKKGFIS